jgi:hypothetical protein
MNRSWITIAIEGMAIFALSFSLGNVMKAQAVTDSAQINKLFAEVKTHAMEADDDAATLDAYARSGQVTRQSHGMKLESIKEHVNDLIKDCNQMSSTRAEGSPWQQEAIDRINPLLHDMADQLTATIEHLNANQSRVHMLPYQEYVHAQYELIHKTHNLITDFADYSEARATVNSLEKALSLPTVADEKQ